MMGCLFVCLLARKCAKTSYKKKEEQEERKKEEKKDSKLELLVQIFVIVRNTVYIL